MNAAEFQHTFRQEWQKLGYRPNVRVEFTPKHPTSLLAIEVKAVATNDAGPTIQISFPDHANYPNHR